MSVKQIDNPNGAHGYTDLTTKAPYATGEFKTTAAVAAKRAVQVSATGTVAVAATGGTPKLVVGFALNAAASGDTVQVVTSGIVENVPYTGDAPAAGDLLTISAATAGSVITLAAATAEAAVGLCIGVAIGAGADGVVDVLVMKA